MKKIYWQRMGERRAFTWPVGLAMATGYAASFFFLQYLGDPELSPDWFLVWFFAQVGVLVTFFAIKFLVLDRLSYDQPRPWLHVFLVFSLGMLQALFSNWMQVSWGLPTLGQLFFVVLASGAYKLVLFGLATSLYQSYKINKASLASLLKTQNALLGLRESAEVIVLEEELRLVQQTQDELMPQLELLDASLESTGFIREQRAKLIQDIRNTIDTKVRPLSDELKSSAQVRAVPLTSSRLQPIRLRVPSRLSLRDAFRPGEIFSLVALTFVGAPYLFLGSIWGLFGLIAALQFGLWLWLFRSLIPAKATLKTATGVLVLTLLALVPMIPVSLTLFAFARDVAGAQLVTNASIVAVGISAAGLAFLHGLYQELDASQLELALRIEELERETSRFEQQLWSARRNWGYVIHGTVQSSLTAAMLHLQTHKGTDEDLIKIVRQDIRRALQALGEKPVARADLKSAMADLSDTWAGVCDIDWQIADEARQELLADPDLCFCTKEIVKEAIANAVRHGGATSVSVSLAIESDHTLVLEAVNNGRVLDKAAEAGLGSQIIRDLSYFWSISSDEASGLTSLIAKMALPRG